MKMECRRISTALSLAVLLVGWNPAHAQTLLGTAFTSQEGEFAVDWSTVDTGGTVSKGGSYAVGHTAGQPDAWVLEGVPYSLSGGFWGYSAAQVSPSPTPTSSPIPTASPTPTLTRTPGGPTATPTTGCAPDYDLDGDGQIDADDLLLFIRHTHEGNLRSDFNCDDRVDSKDLFLFSRQWEGD